MKTAYLMVLACCVMLANVQAADLEAGRSKAYLCTECHGDRGISNIGHYPNLAGQKYDYLVLALQAYKNRVRPDPTMQIMAQNLSETDIENIAAWFSSLSCR
ncbi:MAG: cytochrome c [Chromatiales bacterium]|jgi:cytochrome c553